jgi:hypothetical protein
MNINSIQQQPATFKSKVNRNYEALSYLKGIKNHNMPIKTQMQEIENNGISDLVFIELVTLPDKTRKLVMQVVRDGGNKGYKGISEKILESATGENLNLKAMYTDAVKNLNTPVSRYKELAKLA